MKFHHRCFLVVILMLSLGSNVNAQHSTELTPGYYVVVGAYAPSRENVAQNYTEVLLRAGYDAAYGFNSSKRLFFVYVHYFSTLKESLNGMVSLRKKPEFAQSWVRVVPGDITGPRVNTIAKNKQPSVAPSKQEEKQEAVVTAPTPATEQKEVGPRQESTPTSSEANETKKSVEAVPTTNTPVVDNAPIKQYTPITLGNTEVFLSLFNATNNRIVEGSIKVVDTERSKLLKDVKGNEYLVLPDPKSKSGQLTLICEAFGYRKIQSEINYPLPLADTVKDNIDLMGTTFVINFDLIRYRLGDIATLYNVYFYNDAAVMVPESKFELNSLLQMMQENPKYKIRLHGHTNGNYHGKIIKMGDNKSFFSLDGSVSTLGSAKDLSYNRADVIKEYLAANGVDATRVEVKAWGGKRPLFDKHGANAKKNVRVEVEILSE